MTKITCETEGHLYNSTGKCVMCGHPKPEAALTSNLVNAARAFLERETEMAKGSYREWDGNGWIWNDEVWERSDPEGFPLVKALREALSGDPSAPEAPEQGPWWTPTVEIERLMRWCKGSQTITVEISTKVLEGLLHDSLLWRADRLKSQPSTVETSDRIVCMTCLAQALGHKWSTPTKLWCNRADCPGSSAQETSKKPRLRDSDAAFNMGVLPTEQPEKASAPLPTCQHDLLQPNTTIAVDPADSFHAWCTVCKHDFRTRAPLEVSEPLNLACEGFVPDPHSRFCDRCGYPQHDHHRPSQKASAPHEMPARLIVSEEEARSPLAFRHWSKDPLVPYRDCHCDTCAESRNAQNGKGDGK